MTQQTTCNAPDCNETLTADKYGRGRGVMRGGAFYCDMDCFHAYQHAEIDRICNEIKQ